MPAPWCPPRRIPCGPAETGEMGIRPTLPPLTTTEVAKVNETSFQAFGYKQSRAMNLERKEIQEVRSSVTGLSAGERFSAGAQGSGRECEKAQAFAGSKDCSDIRNQCATCFLK